MLSWTWPAAAPRFPDLTAKIAPRVSFDISHLLASWPYDPDELSVRVIPGADGRNRIQVRLDLGILQLEMDGRPDGIRPEGHESWLDYFVARQRDHDAAHPDSAAFQLSSEDCALLQREGVQYYHRYLSFWHLEMFELCARDTARNLRLFKFVREHARYERDRLSFDQWRPYVTMMHARAVATPLVRLGQHESALRALQVGIDGIRAYLKEYGQTEQADQCAELVQLEKLYAHVAGQHAPGAPADPRAEQLESLQKQLDQAIAQEAFEEAARLRDEIRQLSQPAGE